MAAAMAKVLRGASSGSSTRLPIPAVFRGMAQEGIPQGSSPGAKLPLGRLWSFMSDDGHDLPIRVFYMLGAMSMGILLPKSSIWKRIKGE